MIKKTYRSFGSYSGREAMFNNVTQQKFRIAGQIYDQAFNFIGIHPAERGGMIGRASDGVVRQFEPDYGGHCNTAAYDPDIEHLNKVIKEWKAKGIEFCGFLHSHPAGMRRPSGHDRWYSGKILDCFKKLELLWIPIIQTTPNTGRFELLPYAAVPTAMNREKCDIITCSLDIVGSYKEMTQTTPHITYDKKYGDRRKPHCHAPAKNTNTNPYNVPKKIERSPKNASPSFNSKDIEARKFSSIKKDTSETYFGVQKHYWSPVFSEKDEALSLSDKKLKILCNDWTKACDNHKRYFSRLADDYDLEFLDKVRLIFIGNGGASSLIHNCARMGFGEFVLIDPDTVSDTNIGTQDALPSAIGKDKVEALGQTVTELNPKAAVVAYTSKIDDFDDEKFSHLISSPLRWNPDTEKFKHTPSASTYGWQPHKINPIVPEITILMVLTDNFYAQSRGHRLGLHFAIPTICAQEYVEGIGGEVTYTIPGITPACHRCITASRYKAYLQENFKNDVTSAGAPVFAADFLNSVLGHMLLAVVHQGTEHPRWGNVITNLGDRNLLRIRMDNSFDKRFGVNAFSQRVEGTQDPGAFFMLDTLFLSQTPDSGQSENRPICPDCGGTGNLLDAKGKFDDTRKILA